jgi:C1A family cysteine protease
MAAVAVNPVSIAIEADEIMDYSWGVFNDGSCGTNLDHGVLMVGYTVYQPKKLDYWIVKNSWGMDWGENGYIRFAKDEKKPVNVCGIMIESEYPIA